MSRYIHLNPVETKMMAKKALKERVAYLRSYRWSSYRCYLGKMKAAFLEKGPLLAQVGMGKKASSSAYRRYVERGLVERDGELEELLKSSPLGIGSEAFIEDIEKRYEMLVEGSASREDISLRRIGKKVKPQEILRAVGEAYGVERKDLLRRRRGAVDRAVAAELLVKHAGLTQRAVGALLNMGSGSAVSQQIKRLSEDSAPINAKRRKQAERLIVTSN